MNNGIITGNTLDMMNELSRIARSLNEQGMDKDIIRGAIENGLKSEEEMKEEAEKQINKVEKLSKELKIKEEEEKILKNIKEYMQINIDKGFHKFIYNDLGYEEKCIDVINAIEHILSDYKRVLKKNEQLSTEVNSLKKENEELKELMAHKNGYTKKLEQDLFENARNYVISIQKVKDKIEELEEQYKIALEENTTKAFIIKWQTTILQELIEEREEK